MSRADGEAFSLISFQATEIRDDPWNADRIRVRGTLAVGGAVEAEFTLDGTTDGNGGLEDFQTFVLPPSFAGLSEVAFRGFGPVGPGHYNLDNLVVPQPSTLLLVGTGLTLLAARRFRRSGLEAGLVAEPGRSTRHRSGSAAMPIRLAAWMSADSERNRAIVLELTEVIWNQRALERIPEFYSPDYVVDYRPYAPVREGHDAIRGMVERAWAAFPDYHEEIRDVIADETRVAARFTVSGTQSGQWGLLPLTVKRVEFE